MSDDIYLFWNWTDKWGVLLVLCWVEGLVVFLDYIPVNNSPRLFNQK